MHQNELYHVGVKGMRWGHRKNNKPKGDEKIRKTVKQRINNGKRMSSHLLLKVQQQVEQQQRINQQDQFTQQQILQQQSFNQQNQIFDQQNMINQMNMPTFF